MKISTKHGFAFLCTPKCASTAIEEAIDELCNISYVGSPRLRHINAHTYVEHILPAHQALMPSVEIESVCMIRDPFKWIQSLYRYRSREALKNPDHPNHSRYTGNITYSEFIDAYTSEGRRPADGQVRTQFGFMCLEDGTIGVDRIFPFERLDLFWSWLLEKTGVEISIPHKK